MLNSSKIQFFISKQAAQPGHIGLLNPCFLQYLFLGEDLFPGSVSQYLAVGHDNDTLEILRHEIHIVKNGQHGPPL